MNHELAHVLDGAQVDRQRRLAGAGAPLRAVGAIDRVFRPLVRGASGGAGRGLAQGQVGVAPVDLHLVNACGGVTVTGGGRHGQANVPRVGVGDDVRGYVGGVSSHRHRIGPG